jgi:hypothetical protein
MRGIMAKQTRANFHPKASETTTPEISVEMQIRMIPSALPLKPVKSLVESDRNEERAAAEFSFLSK